MASALPFGKLQKRHSVHEGVLHDFAAESAAMALI